jgi:hypothetical protein
VHESNKWNESKQYTPAALSLGWSTSVASVANQGNTAFHALRSTAAHRFDPFFHPFNPFLSVSPPVNALNRAALARNGNLRSGWLQQIGNTEKNGLNGWKRKRPKAQSVMLEAAPTASRAFAQEQSTW